MAYITIKLITPNLRFSCTFLTISFLQSIDFRGLALGLKAAKYDDVEFAARIEESPHFIMFYAPWCGHCKRLQPMWDKFAEHYSAPGTELTIAKVDCTQHTPLCAQEDIKSYPTLRLFHKGNKSTYRGNRNLEDLKTFVTEELSPDHTHKKDNMNEIPTERSETLSEPVTVIELNENTFYEGIADGLHFVMFYAPWCPHCQQLKPVWDELGNSYLSSNFISIEKIDCTKHKQICEEQSVDAYPMLIVYYDGKKVNEFSGQRTLANLVEFSDKMLQNYIPAPEPQDEDKEASNNSENEQPEPAEVAVSLNKENFDLALRSGRVFVDFYAPWCVHCQKLASVWEQLALKVMVDDAGGSVTIAKVDCTVEEEICIKQSIHSYPTLIVFQPNGEKQIYTGSRTLESLYQFALGVSHDEL